MGWLSDAEVLSTLLSEARHDATRLGHGPTGWAPGERPGSYVAACPRCWATGTIVLRRLGSAPTTGALVNLSCLPAVAS